MSANYDRDEKAEILAALRRGEDGPACPACATTLVRRGVPPKEEVAYVRDRIWLLCPSCRRSAVFDRSEVERGDPGPR